MIRVLGQIEQLQSDVQIAIKTKTRSMFFLDTHTNICCVSVSAEQDPTDLGTLASAGRPYFEICSVFPDEHDDITLLDAYGNHMFCHQGCISVDELSAALKDAHERRTAFYTDRAEQYGDSAWPKGATVGL